MSSETGLGEIYVQPFPTTGAKYQISINIGRAPAWSPDGKQLFYHHTPANQLVAVDIRTTPSFAFENPTPLPIEGTIHPVSARNYDITPDGKQFVVVLPASSSTTRSDKPTPQQINVVVHWFEDLKQRVPVK